MTSTDVIQSTLRLPRPLWVQINKVAASKNLSMQQAVQQAIVEYCARDRTEHFEAKVRAFDKAARELVIDSEQKRFIEAARRIYPRKKKNASRRKS